MKLTQADQGIWRSLEQDIILDEAIEETIDILGFDFAVLYLIPAAGEAAQQVRSQNYPAAAAEHNPVAQVVANQYHKPLQERVQQSLPQTLRLATLTEALETMPRWLTLIVSPHYLGEPRQLLGLLEAGYDDATQQRQAAMPQQDLIDLGEQLFTALEHARLFHEATDQAARLASLHHIGWEVATTRDLVQVLNEVGQHLRTVLRADVVMLYRYDRQRERLEHPRIFGHIKGKGPLQLPSTERGIVATVLAQQQPYYAVEAQQDPQLMTPTPIGDATQARLQRSFTVRQGIISFAGVPMMANNRAVGVLCVNYRRRHLFSENERQILEIAAQFAAVALHNAEMNDLAEAMISSRTRRQLARQLHDSLSQYLPAIRLMAETAQTVLAGRAPQASAQLTKIQRVTLKAIDEVRANIFELNARQLANRDLPAALEDCVAEAQHFFDLTIDLRITLSPSPPLPTPIAREILMIFREGIANTAKHAQATHLILKLTSQADEIHLLIADDGGGFVPETVRGPARRGLRMMQERVDKLRGQLTLVSQLQAGTTIQIVIPWQ